MERQLIKKTWSGSCIHVFVVLQVNYQSGKPINVVSQATMGG